ncbi:MAG: PAS domain S-box protein [Verrucomicrobiota bacterium]
MKDEIAHNVIPRPALVSDDKFRLLVEHSLVGIYVIQDNRFVYVNSTMAEIFGFSREELTSAPLLDFVFEEDRWLVGENVRKRIQGQVESIRYTLRAVRKDGSVIYIEAHGSQTEYEGRSAVLGMLLDITRRKHDEERIKTSVMEDRNLKAALDEHAIVSVTDQQGMITYANDKFCSISKYSREELLGQDHRIINSGYHSKEFIQALWRTIVQGRIWKGEIRNRAKDGTFYWVATTIIPFLNAERKPEQYVSIHADITERKQAEAELEKAHQQMIESSHRAASFSRN